MMHRFTLMFLFQLLFIGHSVFAQDFTQNNPTTSLPHDFIVHLKRAISGNDDYSLKQLLEPHHHFDLSCPQFAQLPAGATFLHHVASLTYPECAQVLLMHGAPVNERDNDACTPLHYAMSPGDVSIDDALEVIELLITHGVQINAQDNVGRTALKRGIEWPIHEAGIALLLDAGADVNIQDQNGSTALHEAVFGELDAVVNLLMNRIDIDTSLRDLLHQQTALELAQANGLLDIAAIIVQKEQEHFRLARAIFFRVKLALRENKPKALKSLLASNPTLIRMLREEESGNTIAHLAVKSRRGALVDVVIAHCPELFQIENKKGVAPLRQFMAVSYFMSKQEARSASVSHDENEVNKDASIYVVNGCKRLRKN